MSNIDHVKVTNVASKVSWDTDGLAMVITKPAPRVIVSSVKKKPPNGFFTNLNHVFVITGTMDMDQTPFTSGQLHYQSHDSEPPTNYAFG